MQKFQFQIVYKKGPNCLPIIFLGTSSMPSPGNPATFCRNKRQTRWSTPNETSSSPSTFQLIHSYVNFYPSTPRTPSSRTSWFGDDSNAKLSPDAPSSCSPRNWSPKSFMRSTNMTLTTHRALPTPRKSTPRLLLGRNGPRHCQPPTPLLPVSTLPPDDLSPY